MPFAFVLISCICSCKKSGQNITPTPANSFKVDVVNGFGSGTYKVGDTVHIWSRTQASSEIFDAWVGNNSTFINGNNEWHSSFIMPNKDILITANFKTLNLTMQYEKIRGKSNLKNVYYYFPLNQQGIVYLFHGSNGTAQNWISSYETNSMIKDLASSGYGIIITEAEEVTLNNDTNGDGSLRWVSNVYDSVSNVDFANIKAITDTFYARGYASRTTTRYSIGQSNGGSCSIAFGAYFRLKASVAYCASGGAAGGFLTTTSTPVLYCLQRNDNNSVMGQTGNANAISNSLSLNARGICSKYNVNQPSPLYPERFSRTGVISSILSNQVFNEIKANNLLSSKNYMKGYAQSLWDAITANPQNFPVSAALTSVQKNIVDEQLNCIATDHQFYSDANKATIQFLKTQCL